MTDHIEAWLIEAESRHKTGGTWSEWGPLGTWAVVGPRPATQTLDNYRTQVRKLVPA